MREQKGFKVFLIKGYCNGKNKMDVTVRYKLEFNYNESKTEFYLQGIH